MLGNTPILDSITLVPGQTFYHQIQVYPGEFIPPGTQADIQILDSNDNIAQTWSGTVETTKITWNISGGVADSVVVPGRFRLFVRYVDGISLCWYQGSIRRRLK